jgi:translation initiation factor IF-2
MVVIRQKRQVFPGQRGLAAVAVLIAAASGCKSSSWAARPSWLGGSPAASSLGSAPAFNGGVPKPSETAKPYPTTNTPEGYVLSDAPRTDQATAPLTTPTTVTYGSTPPPTAQATAPPAAPSQPATGGIAPQVGPYAALTPPAASGGQAIDPAASVTAGLASAPRFEAAAPPAATAPGSIASERMADARTSGWAATPPSQSPLAEVAAPPADDPGSRYGAAGSRFGGGSFRSTPPPEADAFQQAPTEPAIEPFASPSPTGVPIGLEQPPASLPAAEAPPANPALPGTLPPPTRRPDPGYRPGGTSSYRPARQLLEGEAGGGVQPVGFNGQ